MAQSSNGQRHLEVLLSEMLSHTTSLESIVRIRFAQIVATVPSAVLIEMISLVQPVLERHYAAQKPTGAKDDSHGAS